MGRWGKTKRKLKARYNTYGGPGKRPMDKGRWVISSRPFPGLPAPLILPDFIAVVAKTLLAFLKRLMETWCDVPFEFERVITLL